VASPAGYNPGQLRLDKLVSNPASGTVERVYYGDVHGRLWHRRCL
jgi:Tfp pilus tip-associated adhesin PilY1